MTAGGNLSGGGCCDHGSLFHNGLGNERISCVGRNNLNYVGATMAQVEATGKNDE